MAVGEAISAEEFALWLTPAEAFPRVPSEYPAQTSEVFYTHLAIGEIRAAARAGKITTGAHSALVGLHLIDPDFWSQNWTQHDQHLLIAGQISFTNTPRMSLYLGRPVDGRDPIEAVFTGIRFDHVAVDILWPPRELDTRKPAVTRPELASWYQVFSGVHPAASEELAMRSATAMFLEKRVPRQWVRDLLPEKKRGRPPKT